VLAGTAKRGDKLRESSKLPELRLNYGPVEMGGRRAASRGWEAQRMKNAAELSLLAADDGGRRDCRRDRTKGSSSLSTQGRGCLRYLGVRER